MGVFYVDLVSILGKREQKEKGLLVTVSRDQGQVDPEQQELASKAINDETQVEKSVVQQQRNPGKRSQKKKNRQRTMSKDHPDQQESKTISENKDPQEQQESTTIIENKQHHFLKEGLGRPILRATLDRFRFPPVTVFLTMEDLGFVIPYDVDMLKIEEISYDQQHRVPDMESYHPLRVFDDPTMISEIDWIERSKVWNLPDDVIRSRIGSEKGALSIHICGISGKGYGAILRDSHFLPIVARSKCLSDADSTFYSRLNGVALGVRIALDYQLSQFSIHVPSFNLCNFMRHIWHPNGKARWSNQIGKRLVRGLLRPEAVCDLEKICSLTKTIIIDLDMVRHRGITAFNVKSELSIFNKAAEFLANLSSEENMMSADIFGNEQLSDAVR